MRVGVHVTKFDNPAGSAGIGAELAAVARNAEAAGVGWLSVMDHWFQMEQNGGAPDPMLEGYTTLGFLAAHTSTIELSLLVTGVTYRHPGLLAKIVTTLDVLSNGRGTLGIGAAWYEREHLGLGVRFPPLKERFERLEETLRICLQMWDQGNDGPFEGKHYQLAETINHPPAVRSPRPRILIGGGGEKKTLRFVAQYADACNLFPSSVEEVSHKLDVIRAHCDDVGRDFSEIEATLTVRADNLDSFTAQMEEYAKIGIQTVIVAPPTGTPARWIEEFIAPAVQRVADL
ncbi:LLM class F420-dependent oxidoreductase [Kutzneria kofuensis]|uniref:F420-dependent oxidoreductase-like protein n=1 Tax=Kutzneria kofuensis TaxID=103725 RepID=A0A7W9KE80_9PSEU|nr:LLM class F420-dependent oxidoreductase [Kutzneria kofuensis]MBB5890985.1 F420-dependent oxidoreductase-like protein [Kutzneria kofuensis]